jgi:hypothetical protein
MNDGVEHHALCPGHHRHYSSLGDAILMMSANSGKVDILRFSINVCSKLGRAKMKFIGLIVLDFHALTGSKLFKSSLGFDCLACS